MKVWTFAKDDADEIIEVKTNDGSIQTEISIENRPYLYDFLDDISQKFELIIYSTFSENYVNAIVDTMESKKKYFSYRFGDNFCLFANILCGIKCVNFLYKDRSDKDIIIVDTKDSRFPLNDGNFIQIKNYEARAYGDTELPKLAKVLDQICYADNVKEIISEYKTKKFLKVGNSIL